ncbi:MAG: translation initiation factor IF-3 [Planctomycetes bacterium]|nr:translation initiation factor IF-3 [Planctomycetota bacterium]
MTRRRGPPLRRGFVPQPEDKVRYNDKIRALELRVIGADGGHVGVITREVALRLAEEAGLDLVEVQPDSKPPVCKILDYGKFKYAQQKKEAKSRAKAHQMALKELRLRPATGDHDFQTKLNKAREFLADGDKVQFTVWFKGREKTFAGALGREVIENVIQQLADVAKVDREPQFVGKKMNVVMAPAKGGRKHPGPTRPPAAPGTAAPAAGAGVASATAPGSPAKAATTAASGGKAPAAAAAPVPASASAAAPKGAVVAAAAPAAKGGGASADPAPVGAAVGAKPASAP